MYPTIQVALDKHLALRFPTDNAYVYPHSYTLEAHNSGQTLDCQSLLQSFVSTCCKVPHAKK